MSMNVKMEGKKEEKKEEKSKGRRKETRKETRKEIREGTGKGIRKDTRKGTGKGIRKDTREGTGKGIRKDTRKGKGKDKGIRNVKFRGRRNHAPKDYRICHLGAGELVTEALIFLAVDASVAYLFYRSFILFVIGLGLWPIYLKQRKRDYLAKQKEEMRREFLDAAKILLTQLQTGYSPENAFRETTAELSKTYEKETFIRTECERICVQLSYRVPLEKLLQDWGRRSGIRDMIRFADVFTIARRSGGDLIGIVRCTIQSIEQKMQLQSEMDAQLAGKKMEQHMMSLIPIFILAYVELTSPGFLTPMYEGFSGRVVMSGCLGIYAGAVIWGRSIMNESRQELMEDT